jgi:hypothetical protein
MTVLRRPVASDARPVGCALVLLVFSAVFAAAAVPSLPRPGAVLFLVVGAAGIAFCTAGLLTAAGPFLTRRPVLVLDDHGVRLPAPWPWRRTRDRVLDWPDVASVVMWRTMTPRGRPATRVAFLPTQAAAARCSPPLSAELVALAVKDLPGVATTYWSTRVHPGWNTNADEILAEIRHHAHPTIDAR